MLRTISAGGTIGGEQEPWQSDSAEAVITDRLGEFVRHGEHTGAAAVELPLAADTIVCQCLQVRQDTLEAHIQRGCNTPDALARATGASTVCGGCTPRLIELVGRGSGYPARIVEVREVLPSVRSFRLAPQSPGQGRLPRAVPGQHVVVSALIDGTWVSRPYTLTSAGEPGYHEITVKLERGGRLSTWLFQQRPTDLAALRVTRPQGNFRIDLGRSDPIIFFAAGIGITPAMSVARALAASRSGSPVFIDYSARERDRFVFREELKQVARTCRRIGLRLRVTGAGERLNASDVREYAHHLPEARYCICGPDSYQEAVRRYLDDAGVEESRIQVEVFTPSSRPTPKKELAPRRLRDIGSRTVGLALLVLYLAQGSFGWEWPWLESLQAEETYRRWSGALLLAFIAIQWALPALRLSGRFRAAAVAYPWHRWLGAVAPLFFYAHATWLGFGYLLALSSVYLVNVLVGLTDKTIIRDVSLRERYGRAWLVPHVTLALLTVGLVAVHVFMVFAYK
ncbi:MAG: FAD-binding oxidoreductase [Gemmatimonadota bacterium]